MTKLQGLILAFFLLAMSCRVEAVSLATADVRYRIDTYDFVGASGSHQLHSKFNLQVDQDMYWMLDTERLWAFRTYLSLRNVQFESLPGMTATSEGWTGISAFIGFRWGSDSFSFEVLGGVDKGYVPSESVATQLSWSSVLTPRVLAQTRLGLFRTGSMRAALKGGATAILPGSVSGSKTQTGYSGYGEFIVDFVPAMLPFGFFGRYEVGELGWSGAKYNSIQFGVQIQLGVTAPPIR